VVVKLLIGIGSGVYFDFSVLSFQVPSELSAPKAASVAIANPTNAVLRILTILFKLLFHNSVGNVAV
jgi:hypothetical protein